MGTKGRDEDSDSFDCEECINGHLEGYDSLLDVKAAVRMAVNLRGCSRFKMKCLTEPLNF